MPLEMFRRRLPGLFYGWWMIAVCATCRMLGGGIHLYGFTVFFLPLSRDLGLTRAGTSLAFSLARAEGAIEAPIAGYLIDRFGPRPVMLVAVLLAGLGYMLLSAVGSYSSFLLVYLGIISLSFSAGFMHAPTAMANAWFRRRRALAMTLSSAAVGVGGTLITPLLAMSIHAWGWRRGALLAGLAFLIVGTPLASLVRRSPESIGLLPDGDPPARPAGPDPSEKDHRPSGMGGADFSLPEALRTSAFWLLTLGSIVRVAGFSSMMVHFIPIMVWKGLTEERAAVFLAAFAFLSIPSHLLLGWIADFVNKPRLMALSMAAGSGALLCLIYGQGKWPLWLFAALFTPVESLFPVTAATVGDLFGRKHFATIRGTMSAFYSWGAVLGPVITGAIYDRSQSYGPMLPAMLVLFLGAALFFALLVRSSDRLKRNAW